MQTCKSRSARLMRGMTLVELIVTLAILGILAGLAIPAMGGILAQWQRDRATKAIVSHMQLARSTAIKTTRRVVMCTSTDGVQCAPAGQHDWRNGWMIFQDPNANNSYDAGEPLVAQAGPMQGIASLESSNKVRRFAYLPSGLMASGMSSLIVTPRQGKPRKIIVNRTGRARLSG
jgi:type IV fimbrial biogenesis protein FimT